MKRRNGDKLFSAFLTPRSILPMDSRRLPRSRARVEVAQRHRFPEFLQAPRQTDCQPDFKEVQATVRAGFMPKEQSLESLLNRRVSRQRFVPLIRHRFANVDEGAHIIHEVPGEGHVVGQW